MNLLGRLALGLTLFAERFLPDAFVFALLATLVVFVLGLLSGIPAATLARAWGEGFPDRDLLAFTTQMALVVIGGHVVATAPAVRRLVVRLATLAPHGPRGAVAWVTLFALVSSWFNWGFSLIFSAVLAKEVARRRPGVDYRALGAASLLGLGSIWAQGLSGSAALQMATPGLLPQSTRDIIAHGGVVPGGLLDLSRTIFLWQSLASVAIELVVVTLAMWLAAPTGDSARTAAHLGIALDDEPPPSTVEPRTFGERLEASPWLMLAVVALGATSIALSVRHLTQLTLNTINLALLLLGMLLHRTPARLIASVQRGAGATWGVLLQFPFYAAISRMIAATHLNDRLAALFVDASTPASFPALMASYSALLGVFVPSGGGKWVIEAPFVMQAAHTQQVHLGWVVACYDLGEALANLVQPFWMLPVLAMLRLRARDVMGFTLLIFFVLVPVVLAMVTLLGRTLPYPY